MKKFVAHLVSTAPYSQSKFYEVPKLEREQPGDYEERTWRERMHYDENGNVYIPPTALKNCLMEAAQYLGMQIPGRGKERYTKHFKAGVMVMDRIPLGVKKDDAKCHALMMSSTGEVNGGKRVKKILPLFESWEADVPFYVLDEIITMDVFKKTLQAAGDFVGIGQFRPANRGHQGRFLVESVHEEAVS